jgi:hypothetical protein
LTVSRGGTDAALVLPTRKGVHVSMAEPGYESPGQQTRPMGGEYSYGLGYRMRPVYPVETKPFFLTSEFWGTVALIVGLAITAGTSESVDARLFWMLATGISAAYLLSRGIAKSGTKSRSWDPREDLMERARDRVGREDGRQRES